MYSSTDNKYKVLIPDRLVENVRAIIKSSKGVETGGILVGHYAQDHSTAIVNHATRPPKDSKAGPTWFLRGIKGLQALLQKYWERKEYYLGEWHYHPDASPNPSMQDIRQMYQIANAKNYQCPEPVMLIIGGDFNDYEIKMFVSVRNQQLLELKADVMESLSTAK